MPTRWFIAIAAVAVLMAGVFAARGPRMPDGPPSHPAAPPRPPGSASSAAASSRFSFVDLTGRPAPDFTLSDLEGRTHALSDSRGRTVMLVFWATWCKTCPAELPQIAAIARALASKGLVTLTINWEPDQAPVARMAHAAGLAAPVLRDTQQQVRHAFDAFAVPRVVIIDRGGRVARVIRGYQGSAAPIVTALAEQGLVVPKTSLLSQPIPVERVTPGAR